MPVIVIDKIKGATEHFKLLDYVDIHGRITGWQNPVKNIFENVAAITALTDGEHFILVDASGTWNSFTGTDIYGRLANTEDNAIYEKQSQNTEGTPAEYYLVASPAPGMITVNLSDGKLKIFNGTSWVDAASGGATITGEILRAKTELVVNTGEGGNYSTSSRRLEIGITLMSGDNINVYVNGLKYSHGENNNAFTFSPGYTYIVWIPNQNNAGFDLINGDTVEVEIFNAN